MLSLAAALALLLSPTGAAPCGGVLTDPNGVIQTPSFPGPLPVPVKCQWVVDSSHLAEDVQIVVYLTQLFVTSGLTFTEYAFFDKNDPNLQRNPTLLLSVTEENSVTTRWLSTRSRFLVVELELDRLETNHLRVLDQLLDVFGFNATYEMTPWSVRNDSCSVIDCSFAGNCYLSGDHRDFWCSCFPQFYGPNCNYGPVCKPDGSPCLNGGICRHAGKYPTCTCPAGFTGTKCETAIFDPGCGENSDCLDHCKAGKDDSTCACDSLDDEGDRWRYVLTLQLTNISSLSVQHPGKTLSNYLEKQALRFFRSLSLSRFENLQVLNISDSGQVTFHFFADRIDYSKVREGQTRLKDRGRLGDLYLADYDILFHHEQGLRLEDIQVNIGEVFENEQVILSCIAQGSEQIEFSWYRNGFPINPDKGSGALWMDILQKNSRDEYTALLGIDSVKALDEGRYTCHVADWGVQDCRSMYLEVLVSPIVQLTPMSASLNKGDNIDLTCVSTNQGVSYSWTRDKNLFPLNPASEVWEDLKPWGSILRVQNIQKSVTYTCHAQTRTATRQKSVRIDLLTAGSCKQTEEDGIMWKATAHGSLVTAQCPLGYSGYASRKCLTIGAGEGRWEEADFSNCISDSLDQITIDFQVISRGYMKSPLWSVLSELYSWFSSRDPCLRGEGEPVLDLLIEAASFVNRTFTSEEVSNVTKVFYANLDLLLAQPNSFSDSLKVRGVQAVVDQWSLMWAQHINSTMAHLSYNELVVDVIKLNNQVQYRYFIPMLTNYPRWYTANIAIDVMTLSGNPLNRMSIINYRSISKFFPRISSQMLRDGSELIYEIQSNIISISTVGDLKINLEMTLPVGPQIGGSWNLTCARADLIGRDWDLDSCQLDLRVRNSSRCLCHSPGLYAVLVTKHSEDKLPLTTELPSPVVVLGCGCCLVQSCLTLLLLGCRRAFVQLLKVQFCLSVIGIMAVFVYLTSLSPPSKDIYQLLTILLEFLFFLAMSSHLGKLILMYSEIVFTPNIKSVKCTVMGLTTGLTVLPCLISWTAESLTTPRRKGCWWLPLGSASFYTAAASTSLIVCLFLILSFSLIKRLRYLSAVKGAKSHHIINRRLGLIKRTSALFASTISVAISSILFVNGLNVVNVYIFSSLSALLGFLMFLCYILHSESSLNVKLMKQLKITAKDKECSSDSDYNLFNFFTKQEAEFESEGAPPLIKGEPAIALKMISESIQSKPKLVTFSDQPEYENEEANVDLEVYPNSPKKYNSTDSAEAVHEMPNSLDILSEIVQTDAVENKATAPRDMSQESLSAVSPSEVLNRISHDLDYLLNRQPSPPISSTGSPYRAITKL